MRMKVRDCAWESGYFVPSYWFSDVLPCHPWYDYKGEMILWWIHSLDLGFMHFIGFIPPFSYRDTLEFLTSSSFLAVLFLCLSITTRYLYSSDYIIVV